MIIQGVVLLLLTEMFQETLTEVIPLNIKNTLKGYSAALCSKQLLVFSLMLGITTVFAYGFAEVAPLFTQMKLGLTPTQYGYWNLLNMVGMALSSLIAGQLLKRYSPARVMIVDSTLLLLAISVLGVMACGYLQSTVFFFITTSTLYCLTGILFPCSTYFASRAIDNRANASSMMSFINMALGTLGVIVIGYLPMAPLAALASTLGTAFVVVLFMCLWQLGKQNHQDNLV